MDQGKNRYRRQHDKRPFPYWGLVLIVLAIIGLFVVLYCLSRAFTATTEKYTFIVLGGANILVFSAILLQALIYLRMAGQNERLISASEDNADVAREAFHTGEAPYFGIAKIAPEGFENGHAPMIKITFINGGKTPAWHVHTTAKAIIGPSPENGEVYNLDTRWHDLENTFFTTGDSRTLEYQHHLFRYSSEMEKAMIDDKTRVFLIIKMHYTDFRKVVRHRDFRLVWDWRHRNFRDYDTEEQNCKACKELGAHSK